EDQRRARQLERRRHALHHEIERRLAVSNRLSEVPAKRARKKTPVLDQERVVETHLLPEFRDVFDARVRRQQNERGISGQEEDAEDDEGDAEENEQRLQESPEEVNLHVRRRRATASMCGVWGNM